jgi:hypothetical protein
MDNQIPLVQQLNIKKDEVESMTKRVNFMIKVRKFNNLKEEYVTKIHDEWVTIAKRLKKGQQMLVEAESNCSDVSKLRDDKRYTSLSNLYDFLLSILGYYDRFFRETLSRNHYLKLQQAILEILR